MAGFSFAVDDASPHDLLIEKNKIQTVSDNELFVQKLQAVWSTNKGEWSLNTNEGIDFHVLLGKKQDDELIRAELDAALDLVSTTAEIVSFETTIDRVSRHMLITVIVLIDGDTVTVPLEY